MTRPAASMSASPKPGSACVLGWLAVLLLMGVLGLLTKRILEEAIAAEDLNKVHMMETALTSNATLCVIYPFKDKPCDEMTSVRLQAKRTYALQDFVDKQFGGPGKGWFRIVTSSESARGLLWVPSTFATLWQK